jgi:hypothetical protein
LILTLILGGCGEPTSVPNILPADPPETSQARPETGPWFVDRAADFGLAVVTRCGGPDKRMVLESLGVGVGLLDADGDGDLDLFVCGGSEIHQGTLHGTGGPWLFRNDGPGRWTDVSASSGLRWNGWAQGVAVADYDADGDTDLFLAQHGPDALWRNQGDGTFREVTEAAGLGADRFWGVSAAWGDFDGDGWLDLYVTNYLEIDPLRPPPAAEYLPGVPVFAGPTILPGQPDVLWRNRGDGTFEDVTETAGLLRPDNKGMAVVFADLDADGRPDLVVTNDTQRNFLFWNEGNGRFHEAGLAAGIAVDPYGRAEGSMAADVADVDGDGLLDLAYSNFRQEGTRLFRNLGNRLFQDASNDLQIQEPTIEFVGWGLVLADFDGDGWPDLMQANGHVYPTVPDSAYAMPPLFLRNRQGRGFEPVTSAWGPRLHRARSGRAVAAGDLDGDGDLDLVMTTMDGPLRVLINEGRRAGRAVHLQLIGRPPNLQAIGARVEIQAGGRTQSHTIKGGGSILAASDSTLHVGLGNSARIDALTVHWPDRSVSRYDDLPVECRLTVRQGDAQVATRPFVSEEADRP